MADNRYKYLLATNNEDREIEYFWYGFKTSITNFFKRYNLPEKLPIEPWSNHLNALQKEKLYLQIEEEIRSYLEKFGWYVIMYSDHHCAEIFATNIKRWNKISKHYNWDYETEITLFNSFFKIFLFLIRKEKQFKDRPYYYQMLNTVRKYSNFDEEADIIVLFELLDQAIQYKETTIIDAIGDSCNIWSFINQEYGTNIFPGTKGKKVIKAI